MTRQSLARAQDGYELECPKVETYIYTIGAVLRATNDPGLKELADELKTAFVEFKRKTDNILQEVNQYIDVIQSERSI